MKRGISLIFLLWAALTPATESLVVVGPIGHSDIPRLSREYPLIVDDYRDGYAYCNVVADDLHLLAGLPWPYRVLIPDLQAYYAEQRALWPPDDRDEPWDAFHSYSETIALLQQWAADYSNICRLVDVGDSVQGRELYALVITDNPSFEEYEPEVRVVGAIHGNEIIGNEIVLYAGERLLTGYGTDPEVTALVEDFEVWLQPLVNPDGYVNGTRRNGNSVDLNRNFSYMWQSGGGHGPYPFSEPETQAVADYSGGHEDYVPDAVQDNTFVLGLTYHSGAICVNYVWNYQQERAPDDAHVQTISYDYSDSCEDSPMYPPYADGHRIVYDYMDWVTNGWDWYETHGDLNDWGYGARGCIDTTIEADERQGGSDPRDILSISDVNWYAIKSYLEWADDGLHGIVTDSGDEPILATITVDDRDEAFMYNDPTVLGDYWLPLADGFYDVTFSAEGYDPIIFEGVEITGEDTPPLDVQFGGSDAGDDCGLTASRTSDGVLVSWRADGYFTAFNLYRVDAAGSILQRINENSLPGAAVSLLDLVPPSPVARYRLEAVDPAGHRLLFGPIEIDVDGIAGVTGLIGVFPNPVRDAAAVELDTGGGYIEISVYDLAGRLVSVVHRGELSAGRHTLGLDGAPLSNGVYILVMRTGGGFSTRRFVVAR